MAFLRRRAGMHGHTIWQRRLVPYDLGRLESSFSPLVEAVRGNPHGQVLSYITALTIVYEQALAMKCPKCGLDPDDGHPPEYYSNCRRCLAIVQRRKLLPGQDWKLQEGSIAHRNDCFCQECGRLLSAPAQLCLACELRHQEHRG